uniref:Uncharacterized protein n=1 Tax=Oryza nivara TaxID=4536 RepID=A0A0E0GYT2_ORYNI
MSISLLDAPFFSVLEGGPQGGVDGVVACSGMDEDGRTSTMPKRRCSGARSRTTMARRCSRCYNGSNAMASKESLFGKMS